MINNIKTTNSRFAKLAVLGEVVFHSGDLVNIWGIKNKNTLHTTLSRYVKQGLIHRIYKGLYSLKKVSDIDPYLVGIKVLHSPAYVSCESVLFAEGVVNQSPQEITLVSGISRRFAIAGIRFRSRKLQDKFLHNQVGVDIKDGVAYASLERAIADMLYFNPLKHLDSVSSNSIDWKKVKEISQIIGYKTKMGI
jgi:predicted transcriptional regulator of viral defense system